MNEWRARIALVSLGGLFGCAPLNETMKDLKKSASECELLNSRMDSLEDRQREMIRRLDSIDYRLQRLEEDP